MFTHRRWLSVVADIGVDQLAGPPQVDVHGVAVVGSDNDQVCAIPGETQGSDEPAQDAGQVCIRTQEA